MRFFNGMWVRVPGRNALIVQLDGNRVRLVGIGSAAGIVKRNIDRFGDCQFAGGGRVAS